MFTEIERKFLVKDESWRSIAKATNFLQGYIHSTPSAFVRIRIEGEKAFLTIKGPKTGIAREEFEFTIPKQEATEILKNLAHKPLISKIRHTLYIGEHLWEIDEFCDENTGLITAEIELNSIDEQFVKPAWLGAEITLDARYRNAALAKLPFSKWTNKEKRKLI